MAKKFFTEKDIEDMFRGGVMSLEAGDDVVLTELAYEKARSMGMKLVRQTPDNPPSAPVRPYILQKPTPRPAAGFTDVAVSAVSSSAPIAARPAEAGLEQRIRESVLSRVGPQVDSALLDVIIKRVLTNTGVK